MTCTVCAELHCKDDCPNFPPPALKVGSAEQKLQELLKIAEEMAEEHMAEAGDGFYYCTFCGREYTYANSKRTVSHHEECPTLKLERFKASL